MPYFQQRTAAARPEGLPLARAARPAAELDPGLALGVRTAHAAAAAAPAGADVAEHRGGRGDGAAPGVVEEPPLHQARAGVLARS